MASLNAVLAAAPYLLHRTFTGNDKAFEVQVSPALDAAFPVMLREKVEALESDTLQELGELLDGMMWRPPASEVAEAKAALLRVLGVDP